MKAEDATSAKYNFISNNPDVQTVFGNLSLNGARATDGSWFNSYDSAGDRMQGIWSTFEFQMAYTPAGGSIRYLFDATDNDSDTEHFQVYGNTNSFFEGRGSTNTFFKALHGTAYLGNAADQEALAVEPADGSVTVDKWQRLAPHTFATYPACSSATEGDQAAISDSTTNAWGATITGGGADHVLGYCDGTNWTVAAK